MGAFHDQMRADATTDRRGAYQSAWFLGQHTNPARAARRQKIRALGGIRKFKRVMRTFREQCDA